MIFWRIRLVQLSLTCFFLLILGKTFYLQVFKSQELKNSSEKQIKRNTPIRTFRGEITDRNNIPLALDTARFDIYLHPKKYRVTVKQSKGLAKILNLRTKDLQDFSIKNSVVKLAAALTRKKTTQIINLKIPGLDFVPVNYREYPRGKLASHVLGFVSWDKSGKSGIEKFLEKDLKSPKQKLKNKTRIDGKLNPRKSSFDSIVRNSLGKKVQLTIDSNLQALTESVLENKSKEFGAQRATAIVIHSPTGEILSWGVFPSFNPNKYNQYSLENLSSWQVSNIYEPGSTFKILTVACALEKKIIDYDFTYQDSGKLKVNRSIIKNHDYSKSKSRKLNLVDLFRYSSNTASAYISLQIGAEDFYNKLKDFGIGSKTEIELPSESSGSLRNPKEWEKLDLATTGFGQGVVSVTPIQFIAAVNSIANDGIWVKPHLIKSLKSVQRNKKIKKIKKKRAISQKNARKIREILAESIALAIEEDPNYLAGKVKGLKIAGKTGTAQKYCPELKRYCLNKTIASFIGFFPVDQPEFTILVVLDSPKKCGGWGNTCAGPIFNEISEKLIRLYPQGFIERSLE